MAGLKCTLTLCPVFGEHFNIQEFIAVFAVEAFDIAVELWFSRIDEDLFDTIVMKHFS